MAANDDTTARAMQARVGRAQAAWLKCEREPKGKGMGSGKGDGKGKEGEEQWMWLVADCQRPRPDRYCRAGTDAPASVTRICYWLICSGAKRGPGHPWMARNRWMPSCGLTMAGTDHAKFTVILLAPQIGLCIKYAVFCVKYRPIFRFAIRVIFVALQTNTCK